MKKCPYCQEDIKDDAVKCHHCLSALPPKADTGKLTAVQITGPDRVVYSVDKSLVRSIKFMLVVVAGLLAFFIVLYLYGFDNQQTAPRPDQVVYVLDHGLIRFAKVAGVVLAMFVTVGVFLYGFNLKEAAKEIRDTAEKVRDVHRDALQTGSEVGKSRDAVSADRIESERLVKEMRSSTDSILAEVKLLKAEVAENRQQLEALVQRGGIAVQKLESKAADLILKTGTGTAELRGEAKGDELIGLRGTLTELTESAPESKEPVTFNDSSDIGIDHSESRVGTKKKRRSPRSRAFTVPELAQLYEFPGDFDGSGQCIGLIELGGGYRDSDMVTYFGGLGLKTPIVTLESVDGGTNQPSSGDGADYQVTMDIEVAGAVAPGAHIVVYMAPNTNEGFLNAIQRAISDEINRPSILSISWGGPEANWTAAVMARFNELFQLAAQRNITVLCAAGDNGVTDGLRDGKPHVDFPASSPWVLACGGTYLTQSDRHGLREVVWNDGDSGTGGGFSNVFIMPAWQSTVALPAGGDEIRGRGVPDVAANASPNTGYKLHARGQDIVVGGTSAATPLWAGLIARMNQGLGRRVGFFNPLLYSTLGPAGSLRDIAEGDNSMHDVPGFEASSGWDPCTGWGSPNGTKLLDAFRKSLL